MSFGRLGFESGDTGGGGAGAAWAISPDVSADFDFLNNRAFSGATTGTATSLVSTTRASAAYAESSGGTYTLFASGQPRITDKGLLVEGPATNSLRNNSNQGTVVGTPGTLPTNWAVQTAGGLATNVIAFGTQNGIDYVDLQMTGTTSGTTYRLIFDANTQIAAAQNAVWVASAFVTQVAAPNPPTNSNLVVVERATTGPGNETTKLASANFVLNPNTSPLGLNRKTVSYLLPTAGTGFVQAALEMTFTSATTVNITFRIGWPQLELCQQANSSAGGFASSPIRVTGAASTRALDNVALLAQAFGSASTLFMQGYSFDTTLQHANIGLSIDDGTLTNRFQFYRNTVTPNLTGFTTVAGVNGTTITSASPVAVNVRHKMAGATAQGDQVTVLNGSVAGTGTNNWSGAGCTQLTFGSTAGNGTFTWNGWIERASVWLSLRKTNAYLQGLTT